MASLRLLEPFKTEVIKQLADGTGYVKAGRKHVPAGPVRCQNGTAVIAVLVGEDQALILSESAVSDHYSDYLYDLQPQYKIPDIYFDLYEKENDDIDPSDCKIPIQGYMFKSKILEIQDDQMGIVNGPFNDEIKIGPITKGVGEEVQLEYIMNHHAYCHDESLQAADYSTRLYISAKKYEKVPIEVNKMYNGRVISVRDNGSTVELFNSNVHTHIESPNLKKGESVRVRINGFASQSAYGELVNRSIPNSENTIKNGIENSPTETKNNQLIDSEQLRTLREQAAKTTCQSNTDTTTTSTTSTNQYNRSNAVRQYAKKRANGRCEGCNSPAPFQDKESEPYLHVHHLDELSEGGDDSPDNVVCLCPNCHYRIHHGKDGSDYNERLREKVNRIESNICGSNAAELDPDED